MYPHNHKPASEASLRASLFAMGATEDTLYEYLDKVNKQWDEIINRQPGGQLHAIGVRDYLSFFYMVLINLHQFKPTADDTSVRYFTIPNSRLAIRIWSGGMERYKQYCLDFFDVDERVAVNAPDDFVIAYYSASGVVTPETRLMSWERAWKIEQPRAGQEKYSVFEGARLMLIRPGNEPFYLQLPTRTTQQKVVFNQAETSLP